MSAWEGERQNVSRKVTKFWPRGKTRAVGERDDWDKRGENRLSLKPKTPSALQSPNPAPYPVCDA